MHKALFSILSIALAIDVSSVAGLTVAKTSSLTTANSNTYDVAATVTDTQAINSAISTTSQTQSLVNDNASYQNVPTPPGYELVFGPTNGANNAPGYMGFTFLTEYDPKACADLCSSRSPDPIGGSCTYFNIWRGLINGNTSNATSTYTCSMYYIDADESTAVNYGDAENHVQVTQSRGYAKGYALRNPSFESGLKGWKKYDHGKQKWIKTTDTAHTGKRGVQMGTVGKHGRLNYASPITLNPGAQYTLSFWLANGKANPKNHFEVKWNGKKVFSQYGASQQPYTLVSIVVPALSSNKLQFLARNDKSFWYLDDVKISG